MRSLGSAFPAAVVCAATLLGACSQDSPEPAPGPDSSSVSTTPVAPTSEAPTTPAAEPPALPPEATTPDAAGAAAFVRHWFDLVNYAYATGDVGPLEAVSEPDCATCRNVIETVQSAYSNGGRLEGGAIAVLGAEAPPPDETGVMLVSTLYEQAEMREVDADGDVVTVTPAAPSSTLGFVIAYLDGAWAASGVGK